MSDITDAILDVANEFDKDSPIVEAVEAIGATIAAPTPSNLIADIELAIKIVKRFKSATANMHPTAKNILKELL